MKATQSGPIVGKALEPYDGSDVGKIIAFISVGWYVSPIQVSGDGGSLVSDYSDNLIVNSIGIGDNLISLDESGNLQVDGNLVISGNLNLAGNLTLEGTITSDKIRTSRLEILSSGEPTTGNSIISANKLNVKINNSNVTSGSKILVTPTTHTGGQPLLVTEKREGEYFAVEIESPYFKDIHFDWWIVN